MRQFNAIAVIIVASLGAGTAQAQVDPASVEDDELITITADQDFPGVDEATRLALVTVKETLDEQLKDAGGEIFKNAADINTNAADIEANHAQIGPLWLATGAQAEGIIDVDRRTRENAADINTNAADIGKHRTAINANSAGVGENRTDINANRATIGKHRTAINANRAGVGENRTDINANRAGIGRNTSVIGKNRLQIGDNRRLTAANQQDIMQHTQRLAIHAVRLDTIAGRLAGIDRRLTVVDGRLDGLDERATVAEAGVSMAMALANLPQSNDSDHRVSIGFGVGAFQGQSSVAGGITVRAGSHVFVRGSFAGNGQGTGGGAGLGFGF